MTERDDRTSRGHVRAMLGPLVFALVLLGGSGMAAAGPVVPVGHAALGPLETCSTTFLPSDGSTSANGRAPSARFRGIRAVYLLTPAELAAGGFPGGSTPSAIGWHYATAPGVSASGTLTVYLQNTTDTTNTKTASFAAAISGMTIVHNAATSLPNTTTPFDVAFSGGSPFTYTGGGLYVAFDWRYPVGALSATALVACNLALANGLESSQTTGAPPSADALTSTNFRPETRFTVTLSNDISVDYVMTLGQLPSGLVGPQVVRAVVTNKGNAQSNIPVTLDVTGATNFSDTQTIAALGSCGGQTTVSFAPFTPGAFGSNTVKVSVPPDDVVTNNSQSEPLQSTVNLYSYKYPGSSPTGGVGVNGNTAEFLAKFDTTSTTQVDAVTVEFPGAIAGATYRVSIRSDSGGAPGAQLYVDAADRAVAAAGSFTLRLPAPVAVGPGSFYVGLAQTSTVNMGLSFDTEVPIRSGAFYLSIGPGGAFADFSPGTNFKLNIGVILGDCLLPLTSVVNPDAATACVGGANAFTSVALGGTGTITRQWTQNGSDLAGQTGETLILSQLAAGSFGFNAKISDDGGCTNRVDPVDSVGTWLAEGAGCEDGNACTSGEVCSGGACALGAPIECDDANPCTIDGCDPVPGCLHAAINCDDLNVCTDDGCNLQTGVCESANNAAACDDGNVCTTGDTCGGGACVPGGPAVCDDADPCTIDGCDPQSGCSHTPLVCSDGDVCTDDSCNVQTGACVFTTNTAACSDGNACTTGDTCGGGVCLAGGPTVCGDANACTDDDCDPQAGCVFAPNALPCDDGSACTAGDVCGGGACQPGAATVCVDGNVCTDDGCNPQTGNCEFTNNAAACEDGNPCTGSDTCGGGACEPGVPAVPPEVSGVRAANKTTFVWPATLYATSYDVVRGALASLPVGPGGGDELCLADQGTATLVETAVPVPGQAFWYQVRGENGCFVGGYGTQSDGTPRVTTTCP